MKTIDIFDAKVSFFQNLRDPAPASVATLGDLFLSGRFYKEVGRLRGETDPVKREKFKKNLPAFTPSGIFSGRRDESLVTHSGVISVDVDHKDNTGLANLDDFKNSVSQIPYVGYCGLSASGKGYVCIIPVKDPGKHKEHFRSLLMDFTRCGVAIDPSCANVGRLRFVSHDPDPYFNKYARVYPYYVRTEYKTAPRRTAPVAIDYTKLDDVKAWAAIAGQEGIDITCSYADWFSLACALAVEFGEEGREVYHSFSRIYYAYDTGETDLKYTEALKAVTRESINHPSFSKIRELCASKSLTALHDFSL